jgi:hypothetical protein
MRTFVYKRTHKRDPDSQGRFGIEDCMGSLRKCDFDAVIGIGGIGAWARKEGISRKLTWIGIGARKQPLSAGRGPLLTFDHFLLLEENGVDFASIAPALARRLLHAKAARFLFSDGLNKTEQAEVRRILKLARGAPPSVERYIGRQKRSGNCAAEHCCSKSFGFLARSGAPMSPAPGC